MKVEARKYPEPPRWKAVIRTDCAEPHDTLCFPTPEDCPYVFPPYAPNIWNANNSTLVFITTGSGETVRIDSIEGIAHSLAWKGRRSNDGDARLGRDPATNPNPVRFPFTIPENANAIVQVALWEPPAPAVPPPDVVTLYTDKGVITLDAPDGWENPYAWPGAMPTWQKAAIGAVAVGVIVGLALWSRRRR